MHVVSQVDHCEKKTSQIATTSSPAALSRLDNLPRVVTAPSTERPRLMALRSAAGESWRSVGRPDEGATGSVHFFWGQVLHVARKRNKQDLTPIRANCAKFLR